MSMAHTISLPETHRMNPNPQISRPAHLIAITVDALRQLPGGVMGFADRVADHYLAHVPEDQRRVPIKPVVGDLTQMDRAQRANRQTINRYITGEVRAFPADLEESWVQALPPPANERALSELAARYGLLAARAPNSAGAATNLGEITKDVGSLLQRMAPIVADDRIDATDLPFVEPAIEAVVALQAELAGLHAQLLQARGSASVTTLRSAR
jgi:hypothetical protein